MATIALTPAALAAIEAALPEGREADARPDGRGSYLITLPRGVLNQLPAMRGPAKAKRRHLAAGGR
jgi:hypothetical protein